jgi:ElaB/YqjD/DUF883 family membrane-anchored ribosome-binding protein
MKQAPTTMTEQRTAAGSDMDQLIEQVEARMRVAAALERGKDVGGRVHDTILERVKAANAIIHEHPYKSVAPGVGLGLLAGLLCARRCFCKCH